MNVGTETKAHLVPHFIKAKTADLLRQSMLENNLLEKSEIKYFDIQFADGYWYAWFYKEVQFTGLFSKIKGAK